LGCLDATNISSRIFGVTVDDKDIEETFERVIINSIEGVKAVMCYRQWLLNNIEWFESEE